MVKITATKTDGEVLILPAPLSLVISREEDVPADSLKAVFPTLIHEELADVTVTREGKCIFEGIVDEQNLIINDGTVTELIARSKVAVLLDNEAQPRTFSDPSAELMFRYYAKPLGFVSFRGEDRVRNGEYKVQKGSSCYTALKDFCLKVYGKAPEVVGETLIFGDNASKESLVLSDSGEGIPYTELKYSTRRYKLISKVLAKTEVRGGYTTVVGNFLAADKRVKRDRYLNATLYSSTPLQDAYTAIASSNREYNSVTAICPLCLVDSLSKDVTIQSRHLKNSDVFSVKEIKYTLSSEGESTRLTLRRREAQNVADIINN